MCSFIFDKYFIELIDCFSEMHIFSRESYPSHTNSSACNLFHSLLIKSRFYSNSLTWLLLFHLMVTQKEWRQEVLFLVKGGLFYHLLGQVLSFKIGFNRLNIGFNQLNNITQSIYYCTIIFSFTSFVIGLSLLSVNPLKFCNLH